MTILPTGVAILAALLAVLTLASSAWAEERRAMTNYAGRAFSASSVQIV